MTRRMEYLSSLNPGWAVRSSAAFAAVRPDAMLESYAYDVIPKQSSIIEERADDLNETEAAQPKSRLRALKLFIRLSLSF